jgi:hypothetical protein
VHVADCGIPRPENTNAAPEHEYDLVSRELERLLGAPGEQQTLGEAAARYFDERAEPGAAARYALEILSRMSETSSVTSSPTR